MKFLVIGGGSIGQRHLRNLKILGYRNLNCYRRIYSPEFEKKFDCNVITTIDKVKILKPDVILICNPTSMHIDWVLKANKLGAHVFVEKPLTHSKEQLNFIKSEWSYNSVFFIGYMLRFHPLVKKIKEILDCNKIGKVYSSRLEFGSWLPSWHPWEDYKKSYASIKELGGGVINTITHELDLAQYFFGNPITVKSAKGNFNILEIEVEEIAESILIYEDKLVSIRVDYLQKDYDRSIRIYGEKGRIIWSWHTNEVKVFLHKSKTEIYNLDKFDLNKLYLDEIKEFLTIIQNKKSDHMLDFNHALSNTDLLLKIQSACLN